MEVTCSHCGTDAGYSASGACSYCGWIPGGASTAVEPSYSAPAEHRVADALHAAAEYEADLRYLFRALPFSQRHRWGGDEREFIEGVRACRSGQPEPPKLRTYRTPTEKQAAALERIAAALETMAGTRLPPGQVKMPGSTP